MTRVLKIAVPLFILILAGTLAWWYVFLRDKTESIPPTFATASQSNPVAPFGGTTENSYENIGSGISPQESRVVPSTSTSMSGRKVPQLWQVSSSPVAGASFVGSGSSTRLRFVERASGNIFEIDPARGELTRITNTLTPRIYEALLAGTSTAIMQTVENGSVITIAVAIGHATSTGSFAQLTQRRLPSNISTIAIHSDGTRIFYITSGAQGSLGFIAQADGSRSQQVFSSTILGWQVRWLSDNRIIIVQNASDQAISYAYELQNGVLVPLAGATGLTILPRASSDAILVGQSSPALALSVRRATTSIALPLRTIADKCVWEPPKQKLSGKRVTPILEPILYCAVPQRAPGTAFLDSWYRGQTHTSDAWWKANVDAGSVELVYLPDTSLALDAENPVIDESGSYIAFRDASSKSLWLLRTSP